MTENGHVKHVHLNGHANGAGDAKLRFKELLSAYTIEVRELREVSEKAVRAADIALDKLKERQLQG